MGFPRRPLLKPSRTSSTSRSSLKPLQPSGVVGSTWSARRRSALRPCLLSGLGGGIDDNLFRYLGTTAVTSISSSIP